MGGREVRPVFFWVRREGSRRWVIAEAVRVPTGAGDGYRMGYRECGDAATYDQSDYAQGGPADCGPPRTLLTDGERVALAPPKYKVGDRVVCRYTYTTDPLLPERVRTVAATVAEVVLATVENTYHRDGYLVTADGSTRFDLFMEESDLTPA